LAGVVTAWAGAVFVVLVPLWFLVRFVDRRAARHLPKINLDPYHAIATAKSPSDGDIYATAAAALLATGLITISSEGLVTVTERGNDPAYEPQHPIEAALLECFRSAEAPVALSKIRMTDDVHRRRDAFLKAQARRMPRRARRQVDGLAWIAVLTVLALSLFYAIQIINAGAPRPGNVGEFLLLIVQFVVLWLLIIVPLGWLVIKLWPERRDLFKEYCAAQPPHPAHRAVGNQGRKRLNASRFYRTPAELEEAARRQRETQWETGMDTF
jgi:hypothetical protein